MSNETNNTPATVYIPSMPASDGKQADEMQRRFDREDEGAAIEVLTHRRKGTINEIIKTKTKQLSAERSAASKLEKDINQAVVDHVAKLDIEGLQTAAAALNVAGIGFFAALVTSVKRDDDEKTVNYVTRVVRLKEEDEEKRDKIVDSKMLQLGDEADHYRYQSTSRQELVGDKVEIEVSFDNIETMSQNLESLEAANKKIAAIESDLGQANDLMISLPTFQTELKVRLAEKQLSENARGQQFLAAIGDQADIGLQHLLPAGKSDNA